MPLELLKRACFSWFPLLTTAEPPRELDAVRNQKKLRHKLANISTHCPIRLVIVLEDVPLRDQEMHEVQNQEGLACDGLSRILR